MAAATLQGRRIQLLQQVGPGYSAGVAPALAPGSLSAVLGSRSVSKNSQCSLEASPGLSVDVGARPEEESSDQQLAERRCKREELCCQVLARPDDVRLLWKLARVDSELQQVSDFTAFASEVCRRHRGAWQNVCRVLRKLDRPQDALRVLLEVQQAEPGNADVCCALAKLVDGRQASEWYEKALQADPLCTEALLAIADERRKVDGNFAEAATMYEAAFRQRPGVKLLYRIGECLVQDGRGVEARKYLMQVLSSDDSTFDMYAVVMIALSYTVEQQHDKALEFCQRAEELHAETPMAAATGSRTLLKHAWICKGVTQLNAGNPELAVATLRSAAREAAKMADGSTVDEMIECTLGLAETVRGDLASAERHLQQAQQLGSGAATGADVLINMAYLKQVQGNLEGAQSLLSRCLDSFKSNAMALLRMGYVLLSQEQLDSAVQYLQKCLKQPAGRLTYSMSQKGAAHFYLCIALHLRTSEPSTLPAPACRDGTDPAAEEQFRNGHELLPHFVQALANILLSASRNGAASTAQGKGASRSYIRVGMVDLSLKQAIVLLWFAERCELVPTGSWEQVRAHRSNATPSSAYAMLPEMGTISSPIPAEGYRLASSPQPAAGAIGDESAKPSLGFPAAASPTLVGTGASTAASSGPSRDASAPDLLCSGSQQLPPSAAEATDALELSARLSPEKLLRFSELELGDCISHGEFCIVHRGKLRGSNLDVVVKTLHQKECLHDEQAIAELRAEVAVIAELSHPRIVTFVGACLETSQLALVTELAPGGNLHQALHVRHRCLARHERFQLATELLEGVRYLHARSPPIAHLDLKSMNLVLDAEGQHLQICDFGLARVLSEPSSEAAEGEERPDRPPNRGGSPRYMSPECYDSELGALNEKADVWSSGCILIEIFGETLPYAECSNVQQILKLMLVHRCGPVIPECIEASVRSVISSTLAFEANERLAIAQVLLQLQTVASSLGGSENKSRFLWIP